MSRIAIYVQLDELEQLAFDYGLPMYLDAAGKVAHIELGDLIYCSDVPPEAS